MTRTVIALAPTSRAIAAVALPLVTSVKLPVAPLRQAIDAEEWLADGVSFTCVLAFATEAV